MVQRIVLKRRTRGGASGANGGTTLVDETLGDAVRALKPDAAIFVTRDNCRPDEVHSLARSLQKKCVGLGVIALADREKRGVWLYRPREGASGLALRVVGPDREAEIRSRPVED